MKKRIVGLCSAKPEVEGTVPVAQKKANNVSGRCVYHQFQSRSKIFKRNLSCPHSCYRVLPFYGIATPPDAAPLDLSTKSSRPGPSSSVSKLEKSSDKDLNWNWKPVRKQFSSQSSSGKKWFPVTRKLPSTGNKPKFVPLSKEGKQNLKFRWMNPLNRIFLQETTVVEGDEAEAKNDQRHSAQKSQDSPIQASSHSKFDKVGSLPTMKPTATNPFKITPTNSWPLEHNEHPSKPILAPPKFGTNSAFGKFGCASSTPQVKDAKFTLPTVSVTSFTEASKPTFKLKPPVLGGASVSFKRPASKIDSPSLSENSEDITEYPEAKKARTSLLPLEETPSEAQGGFSSSECEKVTKLNEDLSTPSKEKKSNSPIPCVTSRETTSATQVNSPTRNIPLFMPLSNNSPKESSVPEENGSRVNGVGATSPPLSSKVGNAGFIFGQNLENRVSGVSSNSSAAIRFSNGETSSSSPSCGQNLFTAAANNLASPSSTGDGAKSLSESSREFSLKEESLKTKYEEVQTVTGEEGEKNVIQMNCKLYGWSSGAWQERGRGILRLNDREIRDELHSRLVIRTQGTLTVMLNAKIWADMSIEKPNDKSVRFTASDVEGQPKIYLVMGSPKDITLLHNSLEYRVAAARSQTLDEKERESDQEQDTLPQLSV